VELILLIFLQASAITVTQLRFPVETSAPTPVSVVDSTVMGNAPSALVGAIVITVGAVVIAIATPNNGLKALGMVVLLTGLYLLGGGGKTLQQSQPQPIHEGTDVTRPDGDAREKYLERYRDMSLVFAGAIVGIVILSLLGNGTPLHTPLPLIGGSSAKYCFRSCDTKGHCETVCYPGTTLE
jgi:hypothetical protein